MSRSLLCTMALGALAGQVRAFAPVTRRAVVASRMRMATTVEMPKVAIVTGGSRGIGAACAKALGEVGCRVIVNYAGSQEAAEEVAEEIRGYGGTADAIAVQADATKAEEIHKLFEACTDKWGEDATCDILVNNAGIIVDKLTLRMTEEDYRKVIDTNLVGPFLACKEAAGIMLRKRSGRIINMASVVGQIGNLGQSNYSAAKGGLIAMTYTMAKEFGSRGITVNAVCPGFIKSAMTDHLPEEDKEYLMKMTPLGRFGEVEEIAGMVRFLATDPAAAYITAGTFNVDGGLAAGN